MKKDINYWKKEARDYRLSAYMWVFVTLILSTIFVFSILILQHELYVFHDNGGVCDTNIDNLIKRIENDCGSTFITKRPNETRYSVFLEIEKDGWKRFEYIALEDCLK